MASAFDEITSKLDKLTPDELKQIRNRIDLLDEVCGKEFMELSDDISGLNDFYIVLSKAPGISKCPAKAAVFSNPLKPQFEKAYNEIEAFLLKEFPNISRLNRLKLYTILCNCAFLEIKRTRNPSTIGVFLNFLKNPRYLISSQFPAYLNDTASKKLLLKACDNG